MRSTLLFHPVASNCPIILNSFYILTTLKILTQTSKYETSKCSSTDVPEN